MKINKSLFIAAVCAAGALATSCSEEGTWTKAEEVSQIAAYSFNTTSSKIVCGPYDETPKAIDVVISRNSTAGAVSLPLDVAISDTALVDCDTVANFADGQKQAVVKVSIKRQLEIGESASADLSIDPKRFGIEPAVKPTEPEALAEEHTPEDSIAYEKALKAYNDSLNTYTVYTNKMAAYKLSTSVSVSKDYSWKPLGMASYREDLVTTMFGVDNVEYTVPIEECEQVAGYYRLVNPYGKAYPYNEEGDYYTDQDYYLYIHAEDPEGVYLDYSVLGCDWGYGSFFCWSLASYYMERKGLEFDDVKADGYCGTMAEGVITMPTGSCLFGMLDYQNASLYGSNPNGMFRVILPGYAVADYTANVAYAGRYIAADNTMTIHAEVTLGSDVKKAHVGIVAGEPSEEGLAIVTNMAAENVTTTEESGEVKLALPEEESEDGIYTVYVVGFDAAGDAQEYGYAQFTASSDGPVKTNWVPQYIGTFTYKVLFTNDDDTPYDDEGLVLYVDADDESHYCIGDEEVGVFYGVQFEFTFNEDGTLSFYDQSTGATYNGDDIFVQDWSVVADYYNENYGSSKPEGYFGTSTPSYYEAGVFNFNTGYYAGQGLMSWVTEETGFETFTLTANYSEAPKRAKAAKARKAFRNEFAPKAKIARRGTSRSIAAPVQFRRSHFIPTVK